LTSTSPFFFNDAPPTEIYTLSLHDALPIWLSRLGPGATNSLNGRSRYSPRTHRKPLGTFAGVFPSCATSPRKTSFSVTSCFKNEDRKSTRLNSSHLVISYAVFCLKKKK